MVPFGERGVGLTYKSGQDLALVLISAEASEMSRPSR